MNHIDPTARLAHTVQVGHFTIIEKSVIIGDESTIGPRTHIGQGTIIGDGTEIASGVYLPPNTLVGDDSYVGPNTTLYDYNYPRAGQFHNPRPPRIGDRTSIGAGCVILPGVRIGAGAMIGPGCIIISDVPENTFVNCSGKMSRVREDIPNLSPLPLRVDDPVTAQEPEQINVS